MKRNLLFGLAILIVLSMAVISAGHPISVVEPTATHYKVHPDPTARPTKVPEDTATPDIKPSETPTNTPVPTNTPKPSATKENTPTQESSSTATQKPTETASSTTAPTSTATPTKTGVPSATKTERPTNTPSPTYTEMPISTITQTESVATPTPTYFNPTETSVPTATLSDVTPVTTDITDTVKVSNEGDGETGQSYIVGLITILHRRIPIGLGWVRNGSFHHALNVAGRISEDDFGIHQKFVPELASLKPGALVRIDDATFRVQYVITVPDKNQAIMERLLSGWTTITTCTADWKDNLVLLLKQVDERGLRE